MSKAATREGEKTIMRDIQPTISTDPTIGKQCSPRRPSAAAAVLLLFCVLFGGCATGVKDTSRTFRTVVIDAGHGGHDSGARARSGGAEKTVALDVARRVESKLRAAGFRTVMTRSDDTFVGLRERVRISNKQKNSIFVSIHFNHAKTRRAQGAEVYYHSKTARAIAGKALDHLTMVPGKKSRGVKSANFHVLRTNRYPAVLVECGFLSSPVEAARSKRPEYREQLANAIAGAIVEQRHGAPKLPQSQLAAR